MAFAHQLRVATGILVCAVAAVPAALAGNAPMRPPDVADAAAAASAAGSIKLTAVKVGEAHPNDTTMVIRDDDYIAGKKVGHDRLTCTFAGRNAAKCNAVIVLAAGTIKARFAMVLSAAGGRGTITGGAGRFAGARGRFSFRHLDNDDESTRTAIVLTLT